MNAVIFSRSTVILAILTLTQTLSPADGPVSFQLDVQPILSASGCNMGACHGKQRGQNGFQLSLLGFDSNFDHDAVTRGARGRRVFPAAPQQSLLLQKAAGQLPHGGGVKLVPGSDDYNTLLNWIREGARRRLPDEATLQTVALQATEFTLSPGQDAKLKVVATYSDQTERDVTAHTTYLANDDTIVTTQSDGSIRAGKLPGETAIMARYMNNICVANVVIPQSETLPARLFSELPRTNFIDDLVYAKLQKLSIRPSEPSDESTFLRRVHLDIIGRLPTPDEARDFLADASPGKRERLIDDLLQRPEYADHWAGRWADLLRPNPYRVGIKTVLNYDNWIRSQFRDNVPYDQFVRQIVTARGSTWQHGAATLYRDRRSPDEIATIVSQLFLGVRLECAKCHHHPFERWSQSDFYQFAAHFAKVGRKGTGLSPPISGSEEFVFDSDEGSVKHPVTGKTLTARPLFGEYPQSDASTDPLTPPTLRESLADWMTAKDNQFFAKVQTNRVWEAMMGRGLVMPVDDLRMTNPPSNPALLDALAKHFADIDYDIKKLIKTIAMSRVYAASSTPNPTNVADRLNYSRHYRHLLRAEPLHDAVLDVTQSTSALPAMPPESRATQVWTTRIDSLFLDTFGRPNENQDPPCERTPDSTVTQALHLMNSAELDKRIRSDTGRAARLANSDLPSAELVDEIYLATFARFPSESERTYATELVETAESRRDATEDLLWAMINSPEFSIQN